MRTGWNVALQIATVAAVVAIRFTTPGWLLLLAILTLVVPLALLVPAVFSLVLVRRGRLSSLATGAFLACSGTALTAAVLLPDFDDQTEHTPVLVLLGLDHVHLPVLAPIGALAVLGYLASLVLVGVAVARDGRPPALPERRLITPADRIPAGH